MAASSIDIFVLQFTDPLSQTVQQRRDRVDSEYSFEFPSRNIQTLSTNTVSQGSQVEGLLFVPDFPLGHPCNNASAPYIPTNVTRFHDLPRIQYQYVAFAPWFSVDCTKAYFEQVPGKAASAFIFYKPDDNTTDLPPEPNDPAWFLNDGGLWKTKQKYPVYALPGPHGRIIMQQLSQYSGDIFHVKNGDRLLQDGNPTDYVRLYANFELNLSNNLPTLWAFLLIVVAIVLILVGLTSLTMHWVQRRHRRELRRRVETGEVPLTLLGLKPHKMTQADIDALDLIPYVPNKDKPDLPLPTPFTATKSTPAAADKTHPSPSDYNQPSCPICLDDFIASDAENPVRVLKCNHIYHPQCIDRYLLATSTLCPICKADSKPPSPSQVPEITNAMVRRVRQTRNNDTSRGGGVAALTRWASFRRYYRSPILGRVPMIRTLPIAHRNSGSQSQGQVNPLGVNGVNGDGSGGGIEMRDQGSRQSAVMREMERVVTPPHPPQDEESRREWAQQRAGEMLEQGQPAVSADTDVEGAERTRPAWRRGLGKIFPGFR